MPERVLGIDILIGNLAVIDAVEVVPQVLLVEAGGAAAQAALVDRVAEHVGDRHVQKDGARGHLEEELVHLVVGWSKKIIAFRHMYRISECLLIRVSPGPIDAVNNRCPSEHFQHHLVRQGIEPGRLAVSVGDHQSLNCVEQKQRDEAEWEQNWQASAESESDEHHDHDVGVLVMEREFWT